MFSGLAVSSKSMDPWSIAMAIRFQPQIVGIKTVPCGEKLCDPTALGMEEMVHKFKALAAS